MLITIPTLLCSSTCLYRNASYPSLVCRRYFDSIPFLIPRPVSFLCSKRRRHDQTNGREHAILPIRWRSNIVGPRVAKSLLKSIWRPHFPWHGLIIRTERYFHMLGDPLHALAMRCDDLPVGSGMREAQRQRGGRIPRPVAQFRINLQPE
jgi:hypothetical protein